MAVEKLFIKDVFKADMLFVIELLNVYDKFEILETNASLVAVKLFHNADTFELI